jgi:RimJ/RimL family protein N-acetyltransferase
MLWEIAGCEKSHAGDYVQLRAAEPEDEAWVLELQRQPQTRRYFRNPAIPQPSEHRKWFRAALDDPAKRIAIIEWDGKRAGVIRLDCLDIKDYQRHYEVSIAICPDYFNQGIASGALLLVRQLFYGVLTAIVHPENVFSKQLFLRRGFAQVGEDRYESISG